MEVVNECGGWGLKFGIHFTAHLPSSEEEISIDQTVLELKWSKPAFCLRLIALKKICHLIARDAPTLGIYFMSDVEFLFKNTSSEIQTQDG